MELGREHPDPGHPSSFALNLEEEEEEEENGDVMDVMNMEEKVCGGSILDPGQRSAQRSWHQDPTFHPATHSPC